MGWGRAPSRTPPICHGRSSGACASSCGVSWGLVAASTAAASGCMASPAASSGAGNCCWITARPRGGTSVWAPGPCGALCSSWPGALASPAAANAPSAATAASGPSPGASAAHSASVSANDASREAGVPAACSSAGTSPGVSAARSAGTSAGEASRAAGVPAACGSAGASLGPCPRGPAAGAACPADASCLLARCLLASRCLSSSSFCSASSCLCAASSCLLASSSRSIAQKPSFLRPCFCRSSRSASQRACALPVRTSSRMILRTFSTAAATPGSFRRVSATFLAFDCISVSEVALRKAASNSGTSSSMILETLMPTPSLCTQSPCTGWS
mmetsp:Transcript_48306/g.154266  ORF Transcript_48306/g.154266 Transcript_48306/m.154266 type:complete len:331 (+) Transcript_48306:483-1475(+)